MPMQLDIYTSLYKDLGVLLATDKLEYPATSLSFLGIIFDTCHMEIRSPVDKLSRKQQMMKIWLPRRKATKREILSLVGTLQQATEIVRLGKTLFHEYT